MRTIAQIALVAATLLLSGCAEMMTATPQLQSKSSDQKMEVKSKVMAVAVLDWSPDGRRLASAGVASAVRVWDMENGRALRLMPVTATYGVADVAWSPDSKRIVASGITGLFGDTVTHLWDGESGRLITTRKGAFIGKHAFTPDGKRMLGAEFLPGGLFDVPTYTAHEVDLETGQTVRSWPRHTVGAVSPDGRSLLLVGAGHASLALIDLKSGREVWRTGGDKVWPNAVAFTPDARHIVVSYVEYHGSLGSSMTVSMNVLDARTGNFVRQLARYDVADTFLGTTKEGTKLNVIEVSPNGRRVLTGTDRGEYKLWDFDTGALITQLKRPEEKLMFDMAPAHAAFSPNGKLVAVTTPGAVRLYEVETGEEAATMVSFDDGEWLVTTPSGYYNASEKGDEYLSVSVGGKPFTISQLRESFFRPDLVKVALAGGGLGDYRKIADVRPPPTVAIVDTPTSTTNGRITVSLRVTDQGGGVGNVRLYRNGTAVVFEKTRNLAVADERGSQVLRYDLALEPGANAIRAVAFNADNSMQSVDAAIDIQASIARRPAALHAIVIGIKDFANPRLALKYSVADAELFASTLETKARGLFAGVTVTRLLKPAETTKAAIAAALEKARAEVGPEDLFVFYVASHGTVDDGQYLLITSNVGSTTTARLKQDALSQDALKEMISNIPASKKLIVLDTCSAGQLGDALQVAMLTRGMSDDTAMKVLSRAVGSTVLSAATSVQEALEGYKNHGLFTYVIVEGLKGAADADRDGFVKTFELADYVDNQVPELAETVFRHKQYPIVSPTGQGFPLTKVK
ncbi:MAG: caspase family protein [Ignavibacteria bacterium]